MFQPVVTLYKGTGLAGDCLDLDECAMQFDDCHVYAACANTVGSFQCLCMQGFDGDGRTANETGPFANDGCLDMDECDAEVHNCYGLAECINVEGAYECACNPGYLGDGVDHDTLDDRLG